MDIKDKKRFSGIELLKLIAMFLIVISHSGPYYGDVHAASYVNLRMSSANVQNLLLIFFVYMGQIGNCIFLVCSSYFLLEQDSVKGRKIAFLLGDCLFFSVAFLGIFLGVGGKLPWLMVLKQFFPTTFEFNWFVGCYLLLYIIHPALNLIIRNLSKRQLLAVDCAGLFLYSVMQMLVRDAFYYTRFMGFILIYFLMAYCKNNMSEITGKKKVNYLILVTSVILLIAMILVTNVLGMYTDTFYEKMLNYCIFVNPFIILIAFSAFHICKEWKLQSAAVNLCASVSLYIYVIHENYLVATYARPKYFAYIYENFTYDNVVLWAMVLAVGSYVFSLLIGLLYRITLQGFVHILCEQVIKLACGTATKLLDRLERIE